MARSHTERLFYRLLYTQSSFHFLDWLGKAIGRKNAGLIARCFATAYSYSHPSVIEVVRKNLAILDPAQATTARARETFYHFALGLADYFALGNLPLLEATKYCTVREGHESLQEVQSLGKGAILATGHFGFFEFGSTLLTELGIANTALTFAEPSPALTQWRADYRSRWGANTIEIGSDAFASLQVVKALAQGQFCAMLVDRPLTGPQISMPAPGGSIAFSTSASLLAYLADCPIIPVVVHRLPDGTYRMAAKKPIFVVRDLPRRKAMEQATHEIATSLLSEFIARPTHWYHFIPVAP